MRSSLLFKYLREALKSKNLLSALLKRTSCPRENLLGPLPTAPQQMPMLLPSLLPPADMFLQEWSLNSICKSILH